MNQISQLKLDEYTYQLPAERIALHPAENREMSKMLVYRNGEIQDKSFSQLPQMLNREGVMVFNNTKVVQARLFFHKPTGAAIEVFCLEPANSKDIQIALAEKNTVTWVCMLGNAKKWKQGHLTMVLSDQLTITAEKISSGSGNYEIAFSWDGDYTFAQVLEIAGRTPLPPYIQRQPEGADKERYQTVYAAHEGSVAAPTAGLHFTPEILDALQKKKIGPSYLTLHVGAGTFKPVTASHVKDHLMHHEQIVLHRDTLTQIIDGCQKTLYCVGTTSLRSLETLYWLGVKMQHGYEIPPDGFHFGQWEAYSLAEKSEVDAAHAFKTIARYMDERNISVIKGETALFIVPSYEIKTAHVLITNFHQPGSTLLLLVAAFCGKGWKDIYHHALENDYRFLSYGDSCLLFRNTLT